MFQKGHSPFWEVWYLKKKEKEKKKKKKIKAVLGFISKTATIHTHAHTHTHNTHIPQYIRHTIHVHTHHNTHTHHKIHTHTTIHTPHNTRTHSTIHTHTTKYTHRHTHYTHIMLRFRPQKLLRFVLLRYCFNSSCSRYLDLCLRGSTDFFIWFFMCTMLENRPYSIAAAFNYCVALSVGNESHILFFSWICYAWNARDWVM